MMVGHPGGKGDLMEATFVLQNLLGTGAMITVAGVLVNRWMNSVDRRAEKIAADLRTTVQEHREEMKDLSKDINDNLSGIYEQLRKANGRTSKIESGLEAVKAVCEERHQK